MDVHGQFHPTLKLTNSRLRMIYRLWSPVYDLATGWFFAPGRRRAITLISPKPGERILLSGIGTGADLPLLPDTVSVVGVDLSPEMLVRADDRGRNVQLVLGDAQSLPIGDSRFDIVVLNLVLSVVPDGATCLKEGLRVLRPGGRVLIFDKFVPDGLPISLGRRLINIFTTLFGTDITHRFGDIIQGKGHLVIHDEPSILGGVYRIIVLHQ